MEELKIGDIVYLYNEQAGCTPYIDGEYKITRMYSNTICNVVDTENSKNKRFKNGYNFSKKNLCKSMYDLNYSHCNLIDVICRNLDILSNKLK